MSDSNGEGLTARGRNLKRNHKNNRFKSCLKSRRGKKCFFSHKEGPFKKDCLVRKRKLSEKSSEKVDASMVSDGYDSEENKTEQEILLISE